MSGCGHVSELLSKEEKAFEKKEVKGLRVLDSVLEGKVNLVPVFFGNL